MGSRPRRLLGVFVVIVAVAVVGTIFLSLGGGAGTPDGEEISGQSPEQFQPENVNQAFDTEDGEIRIDTETSGKRILVDTGHGNQVSESDLEPVAEALFEAGHSLQFGDEEGQSSRARRRTGETDYSDTLQKYDGVLVVQPTQGFSQNETESLREYTDAGGRVVVLAEPTRVQGGGGPFSAPTTVSFGANNLTRGYGVRLGSETLYNIDDERNDNNFKSIYASPEGEGMLTEGVETVSFDTSGYAVVRNTRAANVAYSAADGTRTLETRREGTYPLVVRNDNMVFVADSSVLLPSEVYDVDNEVFVGNLLAFLASGDLDPNYGPTDTSSAPREPPTPPQTPTPPPASPTNSTAG
jgi:hypothetical protein